MTHVAVDQYTAKVEDRAAFEPGAARVLFQQLTEEGTLPAPWRMLAVLGDTPGATCKALGEQTLITRGTLIPVLDRLEAKAGDTISAELRVRFL